MPKVARKARRQRKPFKHSDTCAIALIAGRSNLDLHVVDGALVATDRYYAAALGLEHVFPYQAEYPKSDMDALRDKHPDLLAPAGIPMPPSDRDLAVFLEREVGLSELDARRFVRALCSYREIMESAALDDG